MKNMFERLFVAAACAAAVGNASAVGLLGLTDANVLLRFDSSTPGSVSSSAITGLAGGESIVSIDYRNPNATVYGLSSLGNLYALNAFTGAAAAFGIGVVPVAAAGVTYELDWNPSNNNLRVIGNGAAPNSNRAFNFGNGSTAVQTALSIFGSAVVPNVVGAGYASNFAASPAASLSLYYIDGATDALYVNTNAFAGGVLNKVGDLTLSGVPFGVNNPSGFEIHANGVGYVSWRENLYTIDLGSGALTPQGSIGANFNVIGLTTMPIPEPGTYALMAVGLLGIGAMVRRQRG